MQLNADRFVLESEHLAKLESGAGLLGLRMINLEQKKREVCGVTLEKPLTSNDFLTKLEQDGVYVDDPEVYQKFTDINVQKLEERLLNNG